jgi:integrase
MYTRKTPSGRWKCQYRVDGKYKCVTADTKEEAELLAREDQVRGKAKKALGPTVGEAVRRYIDSRDAVLSPATVAGYEKILRNYLGNIQDTPLSRLSQLDYQTFVNALSRKKNRRGVIMSPKSIANICGLIEAAARECGVTLTAKRPAPRKRIVSLMPPEAVISLVRGSDIELPVLLAMWLSLSLSEIRGLTVASVKGDRLIVSGAVVDVDGVPVHKASNKAYERTRSLHIPPRIMDLIQQTDAWKAGKGYLVPMTGQAIYKKWIRMQDGTEKMSFHQLRHLNASVMMTLVPDTYAMERGGWMSRQTLNNIYQHTIGARQKGYDQAIDSYFESIYNDKQKKS